MTGLPGSFLARPIAHRGLHDLSKGRSENSLAAIKAAIDHGYGIEIDVQLSADDHAVVFHDYDLRRLTGQPGRVYDRALADLRTIALSGGGGDIPALPEVLDLIAGQVPVLLEIKDQDTQLGPNVGPLERSVAVALEGYSGDVALMSFNPHSAALMAELAPDRPRGLVTDAFDPKIWPLPSERLDEVRAIGDFDRMGASFISHAANDLDRPRVRDLKAQGATVLCWTIRTPEAEAEARKVAENVTFEGYLP